MKTIFFYVSFRGNSCFRFIMPKLNVFVYPDQQQSVCVLTRSYTYNGIWCISLCKKDAALIMCQQHPDLMHSINYAVCIRIVCFLVVVFCFLLQWFFFSIWVFFQKHSQFTGQQGKGEGYLFNSSLPLPPASKNA